MNDQYVHGLIVGGIVAGIVMLFIRKYVHRLRWAAFSVSALVFAGTSTTVTAKYDTIISIINHVIGAQ